MTRALTMTREELEAAGVRLGPDSPLRQRAPRPKKDDEHRAQAGLLTWIETDARHTWPELAWLYAVPNFLGRGSKTARLIAGGRAKAEGRKKGVPDLVLPVARGGCFGLYLELKTRTGSLDKEQRAWRDYLQGAGYAWVLARSTDEAKAALLAYLRRERTARVTVGAWSLAQELAGDPDPGCDGPRP